MEKGALYCRLNPPYDSEHKIMSVSIREPGQFCIRKSRQTAEVAQGKTKKQQKKKLGELYLVAQLNLPQVAFKVEFNISSVGIL